MIDYKVLIPAISRPEMVRECIYSLRCDPEHIIVVDNSGGNIAPIIPSGVEVIVPPCNIGVGRAWNVALRRRPYMTVILSAATILRGGIEPILEWWQSIEDQCPWGFLSEWGYHFFGITRFTIDRIGLVDENFYPAYYEDTDYSRRIGLAGGFLAPLKSGSELRVESHGVIDGIRPPLRHLEKYYVQKWGGRPEHANNPAEERFSLPFNRADVGLDWWPENSIEELCSRYDYQP